MSARGLIPSWGSEQQSIDTCSHGGERGEEVLLLLFVTTVVWFALLLVLMQHGRLVVGLFVSHSASHGVPAAVPVVHNMEVSHVLLTLQVSWFSSHYLPGEECITTALNPVTLFVNRAIPLWQLCRGCNSRSKQEALINRIFSILILYPRFCGGRLKHNLCQVQSRSSLRKKLTCQVLLDSHLS